MKRCTFIWAVCACFCLVLGSISAQGQSPTFSAKSLSQNLDHAALSAEFSTYALYHIDSRQIDAYCGQVENPNFSIVFEGGETLDLLLEKNEIRSPGYTLRMADDNGVNTMPAGRCITYKGFTAQGESVRATLKNGFMVIMVSGNDGLYFLENANKFSKRFNDDVYVLYKARDAKPLPEGFCAVHQKEKYEAKFSPTQQRGNMMPTGCLKVDMAIASDYLMWQQHGANTQAQTLSVVNNMETDYDVDFDQEVLYTIVTQFVSTTANNAAETAWSNTTDPYVLLPNFGTWANNGNFGAAFDHGVLWSNRNFNGTTVGLAYIGTLCSANSPYQVLEDYSTNANSLRVLASHETGHNWGAGHDASGSNTIMAPSVVNTTTWSSASVSTINSYMGSASCNSLEGAPSAYFQIGTSECLQTPIALNDQSNRNPTTWSWSMPGGTPSSANTQNTSVTYNTTGNKSISLTASNSVCTGSSSNTYTANVQIINASGPQPTCAIGLSNGNTGINYTTGIQNVQYGTVNFTSGTTFQEGSIYANRVCSEYANLQPGTHNITVTCGTLNTERVTIYLDSNNDGNLDISERVVNCQIANGGTMTTTFTIPANAVQGVVLRFRIMSDVGCVPSACSTPALGQVEDFGILVGTPPPADCNSIVQGLKGVTSAADAAWITWTSNADANLYRLQYRVKGTAAWSSTTSPGYPNNYQPLSGLTSNATYEVRIRQRCINGLFGPYSPISEFATDDLQPCSVPDEVGYMYDRQGDPSKVRMCCSYEPNAFNGFYRLRYREVGATVWNNALIKRPYYRATGLTPNTQYEYQWRTRCGQNDYSPITPVDVFTTLPVTPFAPQSADARTEEYNFEEVQALSVFPNPFDQQLWISGQKTMARVQLMDLQGRLLEEAEVQSDVFEWKTEAAPKGAYLLRVFYEDGDVGLEKVMKM